MEYLVSKLGVDWCVSNELVAAGEGKRLCLSSDWRWSASGVGGHRRAGQADLLNPLLWWE